MGLLDGREPTVSLERETKLLAPGSGAGEAAGTARWLLDSPESQHGGSSSSPSGGGGGGSAGGSGSGGTQYYAHGEHLEMSVHQSLSQSIVMGMQGA